MSYSWPLGVEKWQVEQLEAQVKELQGQVWTLNSALTTNANRVTMLVSEEKHARLILKQELTEKLEASHRQDIQALERKLTLQEENVRKLLKNAVAAGKAAQGHDQLSSLNSLDSLQQQAASYDVGKPVRRNTRIFVTDLPGKKMQYKLRDDLDAWLKSQLGQVDLVDKFSEADLVLWVVFEPGVRVSFAPEAFQLELEHAYVACPKGAKFATLIAALTDATLPPFASCDGNFNIRVDDSMLAVKDCYETKHAFDGIRYLISKVNQ